MRGFLTLCTFAGALLFGVAANAQSYASVTLSWTPSPSSNVAGYDIYYGTSAGNYTSAVPVQPNATNVTIYGLASGQTYYFAATAYDSTGTQGAFSPQISLTAGSSSSAPQGAAGMLSAISRLAAGQFGFKIAGTSNAQYIVQASTDLVHWTSIQTNSAPFTFVDSNASQFSHRFYRTVSN